jgi:nitrogen fixation protein NifU and related proteins
MAIDAKTLYRETVLDHAKNPRNEGALADATHEATAHNPLCGDRVTVRLVVDGDAVRAIKFEARGCMIACASASLMTELVAGHTAREGIALADRLDALLNQDADHEASNAGVRASDVAIDPGALAPLHGVLEFPARKACAVLPWSALREALGKKI